MKKKVLSLVYLSLLLVFASGSKTNSPIHAAETTHYQENFDGYSEPSIGDFLVTEGSMVTSSSGYVMANLPADLSAVTNFEASVDIKYAAGGTGFRYLGIKFFGFNSAATDSAIALYLQQHDGNLYTRFDCQVGVNFVQILNNNTDVGLVHGALDVADGSVVRIKLHIHDGIISTFANDVMTARFNFSDVSIVQGAITGVAIVGEPGALETHVDNVLITSSSAVEVPDPNLLYAVDFKTYGEATYGDFAVSGGVATTSNSAYSMTNIAGGDLSGGNVSVSVDLSYPAPVNGFIYYGIKFFGLNGLDTAADNAVALYLQSDLFARIDYNDGTWRSLYSNNAAVGGLVPGPLDITLGKIFNFTLHIYEDTLTALVDDKAIIQTTFTEMGIEKGAISGAALVGEPAGNLLTLEKITVKKSSEIDLNPPVEVEDPLFDADDTIDKVVPATGEAIYENDFSSGEALGGFTIADGKLKNDANYAEALLPLTSFYQDYVVQADVTFSEGVVGYFGIRFLGLNADYAENSVFNAILFRNSNKGAVVRIDRQVSASSWNSSGGYKTLGLAEEETVTFKAVIEGDLVYLYLGGRLMLSTSFTKLGVTKGINTGIQIYNHCESLKTGIEIDNLSVSVSEYVDAGDEYGATDAVEDFIFSGTIEYAADVYGEAGFSVDYSSDTLKYVIIRSEEDDTIVVKVYATSDPDTLLVSSNDYALAGTKYRIILEDEVSAVLKVVKNSDYLRVYVNDALMIDGKIEFPSGTFTGYDVVSKAGITVSSVGMFKIQESGGIPEAPAVTSANVSASAVSIDVGGETTLTVNFAPYNAEPTSYQWYKDGVIITGATSKTYVFTGIEAGEFNFTCKVDDVMSSSRTITVNAVVVPDAGLPVYAIVLIVVGSVAVLAGASLGVVLLLKKRKKGDLR